MKKKIIILGSTGSIGKCTLDIIRKEKNKFDLILLMINKNSSQLLKQVKEFKVKNLVVADLKAYKKISKILANKDINIYNNIEQFYKINRSKVDYTMSAINGLSGLEPTLLAIKYSKVIAIANKESIICGWSLIEKKLKKEKTKFVPVDSEHFSIFSLIKNYSNLDIDQIIITASGGPFLKYPLSKFNKILPSDATNHPNWKMGAKISVDSATMMNKVFEIIEAQRIFKIDFKKLNVLIHPKSYVHAIVKFKNGLIKILIHDTDMRIPIFNSIYGDKGNFYKKKDIDLNILNNLNFQKINYQKFPLMKIINKINNNSTLFETVLVSANDELVDLFLNKKISFQEISINLNKIINSKEFHHYKFVKPKKIAEINELNDYVRLKTQSLSVYSFDV